MDGLMKRVSSNFFLWQNQSEEDVHVVVFFRGG